MISKEIVDVVGVESPFIEVSPALTETKIQEFSKLSNGWHCGVGVPPTVEVINLALTLDCFARNLFLLTDAVPGLEGEVQLIVFLNNLQKERYLEITIESDTLNVTRYDHRGNSWEISWDRDLALIPDVKAEIIAFRRERGECQTSSGYSPNDITSKTLGGSLVPPSRTIKEEYLSYTKSAWQVSTDRYVYI